MENYIIETKGQRITPLFAGHEACKPQHSFGPYVRDCYLVHFCLGGKGVLKNKDGTHEVGEGELFVIRPGEVTTYTADRTHPWEYAWIGFRSEDMPLFTDGCSVYATPKGLDERMRTLLRDDVLSHEGCLAVIYDLLYRIMQEGEKDTGDEKIRQIRRYIKYNYMLPISVGSLAREFGFDRSYLYRMFKARYGIGVKEYITSLRMEKGRELLERGYSVKQSARMVGFEDEFNFSKVFKARYGVSPSKCKLKEENI